MAGSGRSRRWIRPSSTCEPAVSASAASSRREFSASASVPVGPDADQHDPLQAELAVLDLGDVLELGGEARRPGAAPAGPPGRRSRGETRGQARTARAPARTARSSVSGREVVASSSLDGGTAAVPGHGLYTGRSSGCRPMNSDQGAPSELAQPELLDQLVHPVGQLVVLVRGQPQPHPGAVHVLEARPGSRPARTPPPACWRRSRGSSDSPMLRVQDFPVDRYGTSRAPRVPRRSSSATRNPVRTSRRTW